MAHLITQYELESCKVNMVKFVRENYRERIEEEMNKYYDYLKSEVSFDAYIKEKNEIENNKFKSMMIEANIIAKIAQDLVKEKSILIPGVNCLKTYPPHLTILNQN